MPVYARDARYYGEGLPSLPAGADLPGRLIVVEGPDNVGRSTLLDRLHRDLEYRGHAVSSTGFRRSELTHDGLELARQGTTFSPLTMGLFYATDFADRLERDIIPALKAGYWVLSDRYFYSICARDIARGADPRWSRDVYGFALVPDMVIYLRAKVDDLVPRALAGRGFDFWESGMDIRLADNLYDSYRIYQQRLVDLFDGMVDEYGFRVVDAGRNADAVYEDVLSMALELEEAQSPRKETISRVNGT
ncbi:MAG TPA: thymidylate kinase [Armatimonadota bacterium]|jgi:dTMP kinase